MTSTTTHQLPPSDRTLQHPRNIHAWSQLLVLFSTELRRLLRARKTYVLAAVNLLPVIGALIFVVWQNVDGMSMFRNIMEYIHLPFILPMTALFFGGPAIVDEMEGRTLTYLTLRPVSKTTLFIGKLLAGLTIVSTIVLLPLLILWGICLTSATTIDTGTWQLGGQIFLSTLMGLLTYGAIFSLFGAIFARSLLGGIVYYVGIEIVLGALPVLELLSVRYYLRTIAGFSATDRLGFFDSLVLDAPISIEWWVGAIICTVLFIGATFAGASIFRERQYHV